ncbi:MAG: type II secretion system protein GspL [Gammaproteobacteria bacterium]|nr:type II secretion system protein GspL [Gammaproteobacteria bacterium]
MADQIHLRLIGSADEGGTLQPSWLRLQPGQTRGELKQGDLADFAMELSKNPAQVYVYVPGHEVTITEVTLPNSSKKQLINALPFVLEDSLMDDIDELHCTLGPKLDSGQYIAAVTDKQKLNTWMDLLKSNGIRIHALLPDYLLSPIEELSWSVYCEGHTALIRTGLDKGFSCATHNLPFFLSHLLSPDVENPQRIKMYHCQGLDDSVRTALNDTLANQCELEFLEAPAHLLGMLMHAQHQPGHINLLQGPYAPQNQIKARLAPWKPVAALAATWLLLVMALDITEYYQLKHKNEQLSEQMVNVFRQTFPEVKRVRKHQVATLMRQHLSKLKGKNQSQGASFEEMLSKIGPLTKQTKKLNIEHLRYQQGRLEIVLELPDLQSLESFKQTLSDKTPWQVELKTANASDNKVQGRILIQNKS